MPGFSYFRWLTGAALCIATLCPINTLVAQQQIATVPAGLYPTQIAVNSVTHKAYVSNENDNTVTVIDERTLNTVTIPGITKPTFLAVDEILNKIYVSGLQARVLTVIDGASNTITTVDLPGAAELAVNQITHKIWVCGNNGLVVVDGQTLETTTLAGTYGGYIAINSSTNKIYLTQWLPGKLIIVDGATYSTTQISMGDYSTFVSVNPDTNQIFVAGEGTLTAVDGATLATRTISFGDHPFAMNVNPTTNKVYIGGSSVTIVDGTTLADVTLPGGGNTVAIAVDSVADKIYISAITFYSDGLAVIDGKTNAIKWLDTPEYAGPLAVDPALGRIYLGLDNQPEVLVFSGSWDLKFVPVSPCRVVDTRLPNGDFGGPPIQGGTYRTFYLPQSACNIPFDAAAYALNVTVVPQGTLGYLTVWGAGEGQPVVSTLNSPDGRVRANAAIVDSGMGGVNVFASQTTNVVLDINGYFERSTSTALAFYPLTGCRVVDTRRPNGSLGGPSLAAQQERDFPILAGSCDIPSNALAYSFNVTALPHGGLGYLTVWPQGQTQPVVSTLNAPTGTATANAALIPAGTNGGVAVFPSNNTDLLIDVNGYFAPIGPGGLSLYTVAPCRALDTRRTRGAFSGTIVLDIVDSGCDVQDALAYVMNATVVPEGGLGYLTVWPTTEFQPNVSTLNAWDGSITSNMVIVSNIDGWLNAFASNPTQLILDSFAYFAP